MKYIGEVVHERNMVNNALSNNDSFDSTFTIFTSKGIVNL